MILTPERTPGLRRAAWRAIALLAIVAVAVAACGSDKKQTTAGVSAEPAGTTVSLAPYSFKAGDENRLLCRLEVRAYAGLPSGAITQALVDALGGASRSHEAA